MISLNKLTRKFLLVFLGFCLFFSSFDFAKASFDTTPPTISLVSPTSGASLTGTVNVVANAADDSAVAPSVEFIADSQTIGYGTNDGTGKYTFQWNTATISNGTHTFFARAYDGSSNAAITSTINISTNNAAITYYATPNIPVIGNGTVSPNTPQAVSPGGTASFTVAPNTGYQARVIGDCNGTLSGNIYTTGALNSNCTATFYFDIITYAVTSSAGANGLINFTGSLTTNYGTQRIYTLQPDFGYKAVMSGTCGGTLSGNTYTTNPIYADCTVVANFELLPTFAVTPSAGANGTISPNTPQNIYQTYTTTFTVTPNFGYKAVMSGTCGGTLDGNTYTTNQISAACTVIANFEELPKFTVTSSNGANGTISPASSQQIYQGYTTTFTVTPNAEYKAVMSGTCGGTLNGNTYTTNPISAACTVVANFELNYLSSSTFSSALKSFDSIESPSYGNVDWSESYVASNGQTTGSYVKLKVRSISRAQYENPVNPSYAVRGYTWKYWEDPMYPTESFGYCWANAQGICVTEDWAWTGDTLINASNWTEWSDSCNVVKGQSLTSNPCVKDGDKYIQYQAFLGTTNVNITPYLASVTVSTRQSYAPGWLISSPFNSTNLFNTVKKVEWLSNDNGGKVKFQVRTAPDDGTGKPDWTNSKWCGPNSCSNTLNSATTFADSYYTDTDKIVEITNATNNSPLDKKSQYFQYAAFLDPSTDSSNTPTLQQVKMTYEFNTPPQVSIQGTLAQSSPDGTVSVTYKAYEVDADKDVNNGNQQSAYASIFYQPDDTKKLQLNNSINETATSLTLYNPDPQNIAIPNSGTLLIDDELITYTGVTSPNSANPILNGLVRGAKFGSNDSFPTQAVSHSGKVEVPASPADVWYLAKNVGIIDSTSNVDKFTSWNPKLDTPALNNGKEFANLNLRIVASDGFTHGSIGSSNQILKIDLQSPTVSSAIADLSSFANDPEKSGIFGIGKTIPVNITFSEAVTTQGNLVLKLNMGSSRTSDCVVNLTGTSASSAICNVTINEGDSSNDLALASSSAITGTIQDAYANATVNPASPTKLDLKDSPDIKVDGVRPEVTSVTEASNNANNKKAKIGDKVTLSIATSEALKSGSVPTVTIMGHGVTATGTQSPYTAEYILADTDTEGDISFTIALTDTAGNDSDSFTQSNTNIQDGAVTFDKTKPTLSNISASSNNADDTKAKAGDTITLNFTANETIQAPIIKIGKDNDGNFRTATNVTNVENIYTAIYVMADTDREENIPYSIEFKDEAGNVGDVVSGNTGIIFDRTKPVVTEKAKVVTPTNDNTPDYIFNTNEGGTITYSGGCTSTINNASSGDNITTFSQLIDGTYSSCVLAVTDPFGNISDNLAISTFEIDTTGRNISMNFPIARLHINKMDVKFILEEQIQSGNIVLTDQNNQVTTVAIAAENFSTNIEHTQAISNLNEGTYSVELNGKDLAGNDMQNALVTNVVYDITAPTLSINAPDYFNKFSDDSDISFSIQNNNETLDSGQIVFKDNSNTIPDQTCNLKFTSLTQGDHQKVNLSDECNESITLVDGTSYDITFTGTDLAGNTQSSTINSKNYDITPPGLDYLRSTSPNSTVDSPTAAGDINITAIYNEPLTSGNVSVKVGPMSANVSTDLNFTSNNELNGQFTIGAPKTGYDTTPDYLKVETFLLGTVTDRAGNTTTYTSDNVNDEQNLVNHGSTIIIDTTPPILQSFAIEDNSSETSFKQGKTFTLIANYNKTIQTNGTVKVTLNTGSAQHEVTLTNANQAKRLTGTYTVGADENAQDLKVEAVTYQDVKDGKGAPLNVSGNILNGEYTTRSGDPIQNIEGFRIDTVAPTLGVTPLTIQNSNGKTSDITPKISLDASDNFDFTTGKVFYKLSGNSWCGPVDYKTNINANEGDNEINITNTACGGNANNESKILTVKFVDSAANESSEVNSMVELDSKEPILQSFTTETESGKYGSGTSIKIIATYNENILSGRTEIVLNNTVPVVLDTVENGNQLTTGSHPYIIGATNSGQSTGKLRVASIQSQSVSDNSDPANIQVGSDVPSSNLDTDKTIVIDTDAPTASLTIDRFSEDSKFKLAVNPDDLGVSMDGMTAQIKILNSDSSCNFTDAANESFASFPQTFTYDDTSDSIRKACVKLTDKVGNVSEIIEAKAPNTPQKFTLTDLTNEAIIGTILSWGKPIEEGSGTFSKYDLLSCESSDTNACTPNQSHEITVKDQNYYVLTEGLSRVKNYCYKVVFKDLNNNISRASETKCGVPGQGPALSDTNVDFKEVPFVGNIIENSANVIFETVDKNSGNSPLATTGKVEVFTTEDLSGQALKTIDSGLAVIHSVPIVGLEASKKYYLRITVTDSTNKTKTLSYGAVKTETSDPSLSFTTAGILSSIDNIKESIVTDSKAVITFTTNENAKCFIDFKESTVATYNDLSNDIEKEFAKSHSITLTQLLAKTAYDYKVTCDNGKTIPITSDEYHFTTSEKGLTQGEIDASKDGGSPEISSIALTNVTGENATVTWTTNEPANSLLAYEVEGADFMLMAGDYLVNADTSKYTTTHSVQLKGLLPASKYSFSVMSSDSAGNIGQSALSTFTTKEPSSLSSIKVQSKALGQATVTWETGSATSSLVEYGLSTTYGQKKEDSSKVKEHEVTISDLTPGETYHFRVKGEDDQKNIYASSDMTFQPKAPPKISDFKVDDITEHEAKITFNTNVSTNAIISFENTDKPEDSGFQGRPDFVSKHEIKLKDLTSGTTFAVKLKVRDEDGNETEETFPSFTTTKDEVPPKIERVKTDAALTQNDKVQAIISWSTDELSTGEIIYKEGRNGSEKKFEVNGALTLSHIGVITSFKSGVVYYFKVVSEDESGNKVTSSDYALLTPKERQNIIQIIIGNFTDIFGWAKF